MLAKLAGINWQVCSIQKDTARIFLSPYLLLLNFEFSSYPTPSSPTAHHIAPTVRTVGAIESAYHPIPRTIAAQPQPKIGHRAELRDANAFGDPIAHVLRHLLHT
jgi:hypothetical protein